MNKLFVKKFKNCVKSQIINKKIYKIKIQINKD